MKKILIRSCSHHSGDAYLYMTCKGDKLIFTVEYDGDDGDRTEIVETFKIHLSAKHREAWLESEDEEE